MSWFKKALGGLGKVVKKASQIVPIPGASLLGNVVGSVLGAVGRSGGAPATGQVSTSASQSVLDQGVAMMGLSPSATAVPTGQRPAWVVPAAIAGASVLTLGAVLLIRRR